MFGKSMVMLSCLMFRSEIASKLIESNPMLIYIYIVMVAPYIYLTLKPYTTLNEIDFKWQLDKRLSLFLLQSVFCIPTEMYLQTYTFLLYSLLPLVTNLTKDIICFIYSIGNNLIFRLDNFLLMQISIFFITKESTH